MHVAIASAHRHEFRGAIKEYYGYASNIPMGWALCDGTGGTPDLTDRFIMGAGDTYATGDSGGSATDSITLGTTNLPAHTHGEAAGHTHSVYKESQNIMTAGGAMWVLSDNVTYSNQTGTSGAHTHDSVGSGTAFSVDTVPPYYALAYIMKI